MRWPLVCLALVVAPGLAGAADHTIDPSMNYRAVLMGLQPGDTVVVMPGRYTMGFPIRGISGTAQRPILIAGPSTRPRAVITGRSCCNTISVHNASYVHVQSLDLDGGGNFVDAVKGESDSTFAHHLTFEDLHITGHGSNQQAVGISTKCPSWDWNIRYNVIERPGTGIYLGNSDGADPFIRGIIEYNVITDPVGYAMEIKHQIPRPNTQGIPTGENVTIIRHNVFTKAANASGGGSSRPNVLVGHWPRSGNGQNDRYEIYGNFFYQNETGSEALFQGEGNIAFHDNVMVNTFGDAIRIQPHNDVPRDINVYHNTIYASGEGIGISGVARNFTPLVVANAVFAADPIANPEGTSRNNVTDTFRRASNHVNSANANLNTMDFYPLAGELSGGAVNLSPFASHLDNDRDFNGDARPGTFRGAYAGAGTNTGWMLALMSKPGGMRSPGITVRPPPDAGVPPVDAGTVIDAGQMNDDARVMPPIDAGTIPADDATVVPGDDASLPPARDATISTDAGTTEPVDSGPRPTRQDATTSPTRRRAAGGGCRCIPDRRPGTIAGWLVIGLLFAQRRRMI